MLSRFGQAPLQFRTGFLKGSSELHPSRYHCMPHASEPSFKRLPFKQLSHSMVAVKQCRILLLGFVAPWVVLELVCQLLPARSENPLALKGPLRSRLCLELVLSARQSRQSLCVLGVAAPPAAGRSDPPAHWLQTAFAAADALPCIPNLAAGNGSGMPGKCPRCGRRDCGVFAKAPSPAANEASKSGCEGEQNFLWNASACKMAESCRCSQALYATDAPHEPWTSPVS